MRNKIYATTIVLLLILSGMMVAVGGEPIDENVDDGEDSQEELSGKNINENIGDYISIEEVRIGEEWSQVGQEGPIEADPGDTIRLFYRVSNTADEDIDGVLGASIECPEGNYISDEDNDKSVTLYADDTRWTNRHFDIPKDAEPGNYDIHYAVWDSLDFNERYDSVVKEDWLVLEEIEGPEVETLDASDVTKETATLRGELKDMGDFDEIETEFMYREKGSVSWKYTPLESQYSPDIIEETIDGLDSGTEYEYRIYGGDPDHEYSDYASLLTFTTESEPAEFVLNDWSVNPDPAIIDEDVTIEGEVENIGDEGSSHIDLYVDDMGDAQEWEWVELDQGDYKIISFEGTPEDDWGVDEEGEYDIRVEPLLWPDNAWESEFYVIEDPEVEWTTTPPDDEIWFHESFEVEAEGSISDEGELSLVSDGWWGTDEIWSTELYPGFFNENLEIDLEEDLEAEPGDEVELRWEVEEDGWFGDSDESSWETVNIKEYGVTENFEVEYDEDMEVGPESGYEEGIYTFDDDDMEHLNLEAGDSGPYSDGYLITEMGKYAELVSLYAEETYDYFVENNEFKEPYQLYHGDDKATIEIWDLEGEGPDGGNLFGAAYPLNGEVHIDRGSWGTSFETTYSVRSTVAHEVFHTIHFSYDSYWELNPDFEGGGYEYYDWIVEGLAVWSEREVFIEAMQHSYDLYENNKKFTDWVRYYWQGKIDTPGYDSLEDTSINEMSYESVYFWIFLEDQIGIEGIKEFLQVENFENIEEDGGLPELIDIVEDQTDEDFSEVFFDYSWAVTNPHDAEFLTEFEKEHKYEIQPHIYSLEYFTPEWADSFRPRIWENSTGSDFEKVIDFEGSEDHKVWIQVNDGNEILEKRKLEIDEDGKGMDLIEGEGLEDGRIIFTVTFPKIEGDSHYDLEIKDYEKPGPEIESVDHSESIAMDEWTTISVDVTNHGAEAISQSIAISFPEKPGEDNVEVLDYNLDSVDLIPPGEEVGSDYGEDTVTTDYTLVEGWKDDWSEGEEAYLELEVKPQYPGDFDFYVKSVSRCEFDRYYADPLTDGTGADTTDQQNEYVYEHTIQVLDDPEIQTLAATEETHHSATLNADLEDMGGHYENFVTFEYRPTGEDSWEKTDPQLRESPGFLNKDIGSLDSNTEYEFRAIASDEPIISDAEYVSHGETLQFSTEEAYDLVIEKEGEGKVEVDGEVKALPYSGEFAKYEEVELTAIPEEGWYFEEWEEDSEGTSKDITITMDEDKEITAHFVEIKDHLLTISVEGEGATDPSEGRHTYDDGEEVTITATPEEGWYLEEWTGDHTGTEEEITIEMDADKEITAWFEIIEYDLDISVEGEGSTDPSEGTYEHGEDVTVEATADEHWYFKEWTGDYPTGESEEEQVTITMKEDKELTAWFEEHTYTLELNVEGEGSVEIEPDKAEYEPEEKVDLTAASEEHWYFDVWTGDHPTGESEDEEITITMDGDKELTAWFEEHTYTLDVNVEGEGLVEINPEKAEFEPEEEVELTAIPDEHWYFDGWTGDHPTGESEDEEITITMDEDKELTVWFEEHTYTLNTIVEGEGSVEIEPDKAEYEPEEKVDLTAIPFEDWYFVEWTGDISEGEEGESITITMDENKLIIAHFEEGEEIHDWHDLDEVRDNLDGYYILMNDLNEETDGYDELVDTEEGWDPIGNYNYRFTGTFAGKGYEIRNLYINRPETNRVGLFGCIGDVAEVKDVGITDYEVKAQDQGGSLVGQNYYGTIKNSYATGNVTGEYYTGGLVGRNDGEIFNSYATGNVTGEYYIGGLVGSNWDGTVKNSYSTGAVTGDYIAGGLVGSNRNNIENSYAIGVVNGDFSPGGLVGVNWDGTIFNSFWDIETTGQDWSDGGTGKTTEEMKDIATYTDTDTEGLEEPWDFVGNPYDDESDEDIWDIDEDEMINDGYPFLSWETRSELTIYVEGSGKVEIDGEEVEDRWTAIYKDGTQFDIEAIPDEGHVFYEWTGDHTGSEEYITITINESMELTAHFEIKTYDLTLDTIGEGSVEIDPERDEYEHGEEVNLTATADEHWYFEEWTGDYEGAEEEITLTMDDDKTVTAVFEEHTYTLDVTVEGQGSVEVEPDKTEYEPEEKVDLTAIPDEHWYFVEWTGDHTGTEEEIVIMMDDDQEITVYFDEIKDHILTIDVEGEGNVEPSEGKHTYSDGEEVTVTATPKEGWYFVEWTGDYNGTEEEITITMDDDKEITVWFEIHKYNLDISVEGKGSTDPAEGNHTYEHGEEVIVEAIADEHWHLKEWTGDYPTGESEEEQITIIMDEDKELTAWFEEQTYTLDVNIEGEGSVEIEPDEEYYEPETEVTLISDPYDNWYIDKWTGDVPEDESGIEITITMEKDKDITTHFTDEPTEIYDWHDLNETRNNLGGYYVLMNDLDENTAGFDEHASETTNEEPWGYAGWHPIGGDDGEPEDYDKFTGTFNGQEYEIRDFYTDRLDRPTGLFGAVGSEGEVINLEIINATVHSGAGYSYGIGTLVGWNNGMVKNSSVTCGIVYSHPIFDGNAEVGGLVGRNEEDGIVSNSYSTTNVIGLAAVGGFVGRNYGIIESSYATGDANGTSDGTTAVGGFVGLNQDYANISNSYATGNVMGDAVVGGFAGRYYGGIIENSYSTGEVIDEAGENDRIGGFTGEYSGGEITNSYWNIETSGQNESAAGAEGRTTKEMTWDYIDTYNAWDMSTVEEDATWLSGDHATVIDSEGNWGYPALGWQGWDEPVDLEINIEGSGIETEHGEGTHTFYPGAQVTLNAEPKDGWYFTEWKGIETVDQEEITIIMDGDKSVTAWFEDPYTLDVTVEGQGSVGLEPDKAEYEPGEEVNLTAIPGDHWYFVEWTGDASGTEEEITVTMDKNKSITAWFEYPYTLDIEIEGNGSVDIEPDKAEYEPGEEVNLTAIPDDEWYFVEWTGDASGTEEEITVTMDKNKSITAWFEDTYTLDVTIEGEGSIDIEPDKAEYKTDEKVNLTALPDENWYFEEWTGDAFGTEEKITITMDEDKSVTARFVEPYTLNVTVEGEGSVDLEPDKAEYEPGEKVNLTALPGENWYFEEWTGDASGTEEHITITMDGNKSVTARFVEPYTLDLTVEGQGSVALEPDKEEFEPGEKVDLSALPDEHWYFEEWTGDASGTEEHITITMDEDKEITAWFEEHTYTLDLTVEGQGSVDVEPDKTEYDPEEEVDLTVIPDEHWYWVGWTGDYEGTEEEITITMDGDMSVTAWFEENTYALDLNIEGEGSVDIEPDKEEYEPEEEVDLTATAAEHWYFVEWTGDGSGTEKEISLTMDEDKEITAWFEEHTYTLDVAVEGEGSVDIEPDKEEYEPEEEVDLTAITEQHWYFNEWTGDHTGTEEEISLTMNENKEITAWFEEHTYSLDVGIEGEGSVDIEPYKEEYEPEEEVDLKAIPEENWYFDEWTGDASSIDEEITINMDEDKSVIGNFVDPYILEVAIEGNGSVHIEPDKTEYEPGEKVNLTAIPDEHWYLTEWTGNASGTEEDITITMDEDKSVTAWFEEQTYILDLSVAGKGSADAEPEKMEYEPEEKVNLTAIPEEHWYFVFWTGDNPTAESENEQITIKMDEDKELTARFKEHTYTLDVTVEGQGSVDIEPDKEEYEPEEKVDLTAIAAEHWYFVEWTNDASGTEEEINITMDDDKEITAHFEEHNYTLEVTIEGEGSVDVDPDKEEYEPGEQVDLTAIADKEWNFDEWTGDYKSEEEEINITMDEDKEITAWFEEQTYTIDVTVEGEGLVDTDPDKEEYEPGETVNLTAVPDEGYEFIEWTGDYTGTEEQVEITMDENKSVTAHFEVKTYDLTVDIVGEGSVDIDPDKAEYEHGEVVNLTAVPDEGHEFTEWTGDYTGAEEQVEITMDENKSVTAHFEEKEYTLTIDIDGEGEELNFGEGEHEIEYDENVELEAQSDTGWEFLEWAGYEQSDGKVVSFDMPADDITMTADFEKEEYTLTIDIEGEGEELNYSEGEHDIEYGDIVELEAESEDGWEFVEWTGYEPSDEKVVSFDMPTDDITMTAHFEEEEFTLTVDIEGEGEEVNYGEGDHNIEYGENIELEASSDIGWKFEEWTGYEQSNDKIVSFDMPAEDTSMTAHFDQIDYTLTIAVAPSEGGSEMNYGEGTHTFNYGDSLTLEASSNTGWKFEEWTGYEQSDDKVVSFDMPAEDITMTADFEKEEYTLTIDIDGEGEEQNYGEGDHNIEFDENVELEAESDTGWEFIEWTGYEESDDKEVSFDMPAEDISMTAEFEIEDYELEIIIDGEGEELEYGEGYHNIEYDENVELEASSEEGWKFIEWMGYEPSDEKVVSFDMPAEDITMTADFEKEEYTLTIDIDGEGEELEYGEGEHDIEYDENVELEAESDTGWEFIEWTGYEETDDKEVSFDMPAEDISMTAEFEIEDYELEIIIDGEGEELNYGEGEHDIEYGENVELEAESDTGWEFKEWTGEKPSTEEEVTFSMPAEDTTMAAHFEMKTYELIVDTVGEGSVDIEPEKEEYEHGEKVDLTAIPDEGHEFVEWEGTDETGEEITITMDEDKSITAHFEEDVEKYDLTFVVVDEWEEAIEGATVTVDGETVNTDEDGKAVFEDLEPGIYDYEIEHEHFETVEDKVEIVDEDVVEEVTLVEKVPEDYDLTFVVEDEEGEPIEGADVTVNDFTMETDEDGEVIFEDAVKEAGTYGYIVEKEGYETVESEVEIVDEDVTETVTMEVSTYDVTFIVYDEEEEPYEGAEIVLTGYENLVTDENGEAVLEAVEHGSDVDYEIDEEGVDDEIVNVTEDVTETINLEVTTYKVTFEVVNEDDDPIEGATVEIKDMEETTDEDGEAVFEKLEPDTYDWEVTHNDYETEDGDVEIVDQDETVTVAMEEEDDDIPGFTSLAFVLGVMIAVALYQKKKE